MDATKRQQQQHDEEALSNSSPPASSSWASTSSSSCLPGSGDTDRAPLLPCKMADDEKVDRLDVSDDTAHQISVDPWYQVGFVLTTGVNSAYVLGYSGSIMVPLGWIGGTCGLILAAAISMYANALLGRLHEIGGKRHIRYRDLAGHIYGRKMYALTWALQYINLFMINTGFIILAGQALKAIYVLFRDDGLLKLPYCIALSGFVCALFAFGIPYLSALRIWLGFSTVFSLIYIVIAFVLSLRDGITAPAKDYSIPGSESTRVFTTIGAVANLVFAYNTGMLPEIQATIRPPVVKNMEKALWFQFTVGSLPLYAVTFMGYWAYGSSTSSYLLNSVHGPAWIKVVANLSAFLQTVIALHIFASPMYEYLDTRFGSGHGGPFAIHNVVFRVGVRGGYLAVNTLVAAMLPFLGDFMSLTGALSTFPLTFVLANHMYLMVITNTSPPDVAMATTSRSGHGSDDEDSTPAMRRLRRLSLHLLQPSDRPAPEGGDSLGPAACAGKRRAGGLDADAAALTAYLRGRHRKTQARVYEFYVARPELQTPVELPMAAHRDLCFRQMAALVREAGVRPLSLMAADPAEYFAVMEAVGGVDISLAIKVGVQYSLWGGSVINLGTKKHKEKYFDKIDNLEYPGCFAMTELHHGSNVQALQTTATFDPVTDEFIIDTPNDGAIKWWIGNAALHGKFATVFARLILPLQGKGGEPADMGIHAFIVPIRDLETHAVLPGIEINDCGHKIGLNGVDNGALRFCSVRIPRDNLLNRFGDVTRDGKYTSSLPTINRRFAATLGELVGGRVGLAYSSVGVLKVAVTIAVRYALLRQQFGPPKEPEISVLDYQSHQHKLMPMLASAYAFHFARAYLVDMYSEMKKTNDEDVTADVHVLSSGLKSYITSYTAKSISICRESCGGHGYAAVNRFGGLRNDHDIFQTFEGDNTVLLQQVAGDLLKQYQQKFKGGTLSVTWNYLRDSMNTYLSQPNPVTARWEGEDHLRDPKFQLDAFRYRTSRLLHSVAARLQKHMKTLGGFGAWNRCLNHLLTLAESHIESVILARFIEAVKSCPDEKTREVLKLVCDLYALERIWKDIGTYRNVDYVAPNKAKAIHKLVDYLSYQVRLVARELVDAFDVPDQIIRAPIGMQSEAYAQYTQGVGFYRQPT